MAVWTLGLNDAPHLLVLIHGDLLGRLLWGDFVVPRMVPLTANPELQHPLPPGVGWDREVLSLSPPGLITAVY